MLEKVELYQAFGWACPYCAAKNYEEAIRAELTPDEEKELREEYGVEQYEAGFFVTGPDVVQCQNCGAKFETYVNSPEDSESPDDDGPDNPFGLDYGGF